MIYLHIYLILLILILNKCRLIRGIEIENLIISKQDLRNNLSGNIYKLELEIRYLKKQIK